METVKSLLEAIQAEYTKVFPKSDTYLSRGCYGDSTDNSAHCLTLFLGDKESFPNGIEHNDPFRFQFWIHDAPSSDGKFVITCDGASFLVDCDKSISWTGCQYIKTGWRKKNNTSEKIVPAMAKYFQKVHALTTDHCDIISHSKGSYRKFL